MSDCNLLDNLPKVDGFFSLYLRHTDKILWLLDSHTGPELAHLQDLLAVSQTVAPGKIFDWIPRTTYMPIVTASHPVFADDQTAFNAIVNTNVDFRNVVYLPPEAKSQVTAKREPSARITARQFGDSKETMQIEAPNPAMVFISQSYYHNWKALVDGKPVPLWRANYAFQALEVPAGRHEVMLIYRERLFRIGTILSAFAALVCVGLWLPRHENKP